MQNQSILYPIFNEIPNFEFPRPHLFAYANPEMLNWLIFPSSFRVENFESVSI